MSDGSTQWDLCRNISDMSVHMQKRPLVLCHFSIFIPAAGIRRGFVISFLTLVKGIGAKYHFIVTFYCPTKQEIFD